VAAELADQSIDDLVAAIRHLEDLEIFTGQRSRMHPGPGWALVLTILRRELEVMRTEFQARTASQRLPP
jgi:hypothetical protein